jgi:hypothetical protein
MPGELDLMSRLPRVGTARKRRFQAFRVRSQPSSSKLSDRVRRNVLQQQFVDAIG